MEEIKPIIDTLNSISPLGLAGGLAFIIYMQFKSKKGQDNIADNHLSGLPEMHETLKRIEDKLEKMNDGIVYIKARLNGEDR